MESQQGLTPLCVSSQSSAISQHAQSHGSHQARQEEEDEEDEGEEEASGNEQWESIEGHVKGRAKLMED